MLFIAVCRAKKNARIFVLSKTTGIVTCYQMTNGAEPSEMAPLRQHLANREIAWVGSLNS